MEQYPAAVCYFIVVERGSITLEVCNAGLSQNSFSVC